jgi:hypothetical protein
MAQLEDHASQGAGCSRLHDGLMPAAAGLIEEGPCSKRIDQHGGRLFGLHVLANRDAKVRCCHQVLRPGPVRDGGIGGGTSHAPAYQGPPHQASSGSHHGAAPFETGHDGQLLLEPV